MDREEHGLCMVQYYLQFQATAGGLGTDPHRYGGTLRPNDCDPQSWYFM